MKSFIFLLFSLCFIFCSVVLSQKATITESQRAMKTYPFSDPDPVPKPGHIYPYFRFDGFTDQGSMKNWKFVDLENEYIKLSITPEIGGKIWGAYEKSTNFPFVFFNNVVKFRDIAMRGAWTSGGIEINFGDIGHDPTVATPVDYMHRSNADGSVSCFIGSYDWASRSKWVVEVNLPKDKAVFTTKSTWYNASPLDQTYYHWMNAGFRAKGNLELAFPGTNYIGHGGELENYPINKAGKEISFYEKNNFGSYKSYHVLGKPGDFYGGYWHDDMVGFVHHSPYFEKLGKKIWIWGLSRQGMIWENLLTDTDGQYVELQSGRLFNQAAENSDQSPFKHVAFAPKLTDTFTESWYPVKNTGGISEAASWGAWKINQSSKSLKISISPTENISETLSFSIDGKKSNKILALKPLQTYSDSIAINQNSKINIFLGEKQLFSNDNITQNIERQLEAPADFDWNTEYGKYMKAKGLANQRKYAEAEILFEKLLASNKYNVPSLGEMAQLAFRKGAYTDAAKYAKRALAVNTYDPLGNYMLGMASEYSGNFVAAKEAFSVAVLSGAYRLAAFIELAKLSIAQNEFANANIILEKQVAENTNNEEVNHLKFVFLRKKGQQYEALKAIDNWLQTNPLDHFARAEKYLNTRNEIDLETFKKAISNELPHENYIEIAIWYRQIADIEAAKIILKAAPNHVLAKLWLADVDNNNTILDATLAMPTDFVFPFRHEERVLLQNLLAKTNSNQKWKLHYYLGLFLWQNNQKMAAQEQFNLCGNLPETASFFLAKAALFKDTKTIEQASLEKAYALDPNNWRAVQKLVDLYTSQGQLTKALAINEKMPKTQNHEIYILGQQKAGILERMGRYDECITLLKSLTILPNEIAPFAQNLYRKANLKQAIVLIKKGKKSDAIPFLNQAKTYPENLGSGEPYETNNKLASGLIAYISDNNKSKLKAISSKLAKDEVLILNKMF